MNTTTMTTPPRAHLPILDALRFFAAAMVAISHYTHWVLEEQGIHGTLAMLVGDLSAIGMQLFFVLSGFVIHYNYAQTVTQTGGLKKFWVARFSRLYPLFFLLFALEFVISFLHGNSSCSQTGSKFGALLAAPYHLLFIQSWFFQIICNNSLIYQYHMVSGVSWSLSIEFFLYLMYTVCLHRFINRKPWQRIARIIAGATLVLLIFFLTIHHFEPNVEKIATNAFGPIATVDHGYQDSLLRWLYYFNPTLWLVPFLMGMGLVELYTRRHAAIVAATRPWQQELLTLAALMLVVLSYLSLKLWVPQIPFIGRVGPFLFCLFPLMLALFSLTMFPRTWTCRVLSARLFIALGQASYSIYLLHAFFGRWPRKFYDSVINEASPWLLFGLSLCAVFAMSRVTYLTIERPAQRWLRRRLLGTM